MQLFEVLCCNPSVVGCCLSLLADDINLPDTLQHFLTTSCTASSACRLLAEYYSREDYSLDKELIDRMKL